MTIINIFSFIHLFLTPSLYVKVPIARITPSKSLFCQDVKKDSFQLSMDSIGLSPNMQYSILKHLKDLGFDHPKDFIVLAKDFADRPEIFSNLLQSDFGFNALMAHRVRAVAMDALKIETNHSSHTTSYIEINDSSKKSPTLTDVPNKKTKENIVAKNGLKLFDNKGVDTEGGEGLNYKKTLVNEKASKRKQAINDKYGLPRNYKKMYPLIGRELDEFYTFMTKPSTASQELPIRDATAEVYLRHAKLFLGWYLQEEKNKIDPKNFSLHQVFLNKERESADKIMNFIFWMRTKRSIAVSYEANLLRGLNKLLKYRFSKESKADPSYGGKSFDDIPLIRELRKLHRDANKRQIVAPRSSNEERKWLSWSSYLQVIQDVKLDLDKLIREYETNPGSKSAMRSKSRKIATFYQYYLVLSFFACIPDRQRTIRELELGRSFVKDEEQNIWMIKHGPDDYKTGKAYGDRPPLMLSQDLVPSIDEFLEKWRPHLNPKSNTIFCQPRTGRPLTQDSVYQIVSRNCYKYTGKKTNPHLLRDMIVTHVRDSDASEKQLEALALYMGHSIQMQRSSYDRRSLKRKVAPAVELLQNVNNEVIQKKLKP